MKLAEFSVKNSLLVNLISIFIIGVGLVSLFRIPLDAFPQVDFDIVTIHTTYPGASPEEVEKFVTIPIEKELKGISGIKEMESSSEEGTSTVGITIDPHVSDKEQVVDDIKDAVERVRNLPEGVEEDPVVFELKSKERPILEVSISGHQTEQLKRKYAETLEDLILDVEGVASVRRIGWRDREFWVEVNPQKLKEYHVSIEEIMEALKTRNTAFPAGDLTISLVEYNVRITGEFTTQEEIEEVIIRSNDAGLFLRVKDIASVSDTFEDETRIAKVNKKRAVAMVVIKSEEGNIVEIVKEVKKVIDGFQQRIPDGMEVTTSNDFSYYVKRRLGVLQNNGFIGFVLVLLLLFLFLNPLPAIMTALGIPIALFITFTVMKIFGITINLVSMLGLIIVLGMLVDDGIIIAENVYRYVENGMSPREAAVKGTQEVMAPVTGMILTTVAAFAPLLFMKDIIGKFVREIPLVVMIALSASLFEAFIILPSHLSDFIGSGKRKRPASSEALMGKKWFAKLQNLYTRFLIFSLKHRRAVIFVFFMLFVSALIVNTHLKRQFFPSEGIEEFFIRAEAPKGTPLEKMDELIEPVEDLVAALPDTELDGFRTYLGSIESERHFDPNARSAKHLGQITVFLTPFQGRQRTTQEISDSLRDELNSIKGFEKLYIHKHKAGPPMGRAVSVGIKGEDFKTLKEISDRYVRYLEQIRGVTDIETSYNFGKKQLKVMIDEEKAKKHYLTVDQIAVSVRNAFKGGVATYVKPLKAEEEIDVVVRFEGSQRDDLKAFDNILIPNKFDHLIPLPSVAHIVEEEGFFNINHYDGKRVLYVLADVDEKITTSLDVNNQLKKDFKNLGEDYLGYSARYSGEYEKQMESKRNLITAFLIAFAIIFIILTAMFRSLIQPFIVVTAIPFGIMGVIFAFWAHGKSLGFFGWMGIVGLLGVVVNDSIVLVDFINRLRQEGKDRRQSLIEAGQIRLRPVLMTSLTTIAGLVSVAYGIGGGDPFLEPMALAIVWGLFFSTILTLIGIPCIYALFDDFMERVLHRHMV